MVAVQLLCFFYAVNCMWVINAKVLPLNNAVTALNPLYAVPCNFEDGLCPGYEIDKTSKAQWLLQQGPTFSSNTGPSYDKTYGRNGNGWYVYLESSHQLNGRVATLQTATLDNTQTKGKQLCLSFYYHMYGFSMGEFSVQVSVPSDGVSNNHFRLKGDQKIDDWQAGSFAFDTPNKPFKIIFKATTSFSYFGDIGLDEINLKEINAGENCDFWPTKALPSNNPALSSTKKTLPKLSLTVNPVSLATNRLFNNQLTPVKSPSKCGKRQFPMGHITGGNLVQPIGKWPWMVMIMEKLSSGNFEQTCGGTLIAPLWVVTAAHCVSNVQRNEYLKVRLGTHKRSKIDRSTQEITVADIYIDKSRYNKDAKFHFDVALLRLKRPAMFNNYVQPICLPSAPAPSGTRCVVTGWGKLWAEPKEDKGYPTGLMEAIIELKSLTACKDKYSKLITSTMLCAGTFDNNPDTPDTCYRDSGGPMMCEKGDGSWSLIGITSWGSGAGCGQPDDFGVYTDMLEVKQWVEKQMENPLDNRLHVQTN